MNKGKLVVRSPFTVHLVTIIKGVLPLRLFDFIFGNIIGVYKSMGEFKGRE